MYTITVRITERLPGIWYRKIKSKKSRQFRNNLIKIPLRAKNMESTCSSTQSTPDSNSTPNSKQKLSLFLSNVRSLLPKIDDLESTLNLNGISLAFITETWLNGNIDDAAVNIENYSIIRRDRNQNNTGGGVCAFIKHHIPYKVLNELHDDDFETLWMHVRPYKLFRGFSCWIICVAYNPPANDKCEFMNHLATKLDIALTIYPNAGVFLVGDFNRCPISSLLKHFSLKQIVKEPTRKDAILDLILTNMSDFCSPAEVIAPVGLSDHHSVLCTELIYATNTPKYLLDGEKLVQSMRSENGLIELTGQTCIV